MNPKIFKKRRRVKMKLDIIINERDTLVELTKKARNEYLRMNDITDEPEF